MYIQALETGFLSLCWQTSAANKKIDLHGNSAVSLTTPRGNHDLQAHTTIGKQIIQSRDSACMRCNNSR